MERLKRNRIRCKSCDDIIESTHVHDFKYCKCGKVFVDGGLEYCRYGFPGGDPKEHFEDLCEYTTEPQPPAPRVGVYGLLLDLYKEDEKIIGGKLSE